ncbi:Mycothiol maleylpyruvate isomerase N-terminal domain-containing protein [Saccharopolyspora shandongensis]|uniref:Mycothiol maleylpyruvate isomerase N-terminal domain-containing protein n=1 Tax=Saccharopolyspora shandongensis TaxID=418495 RepID=A0A1H3J7W0_9PSEU|nr:maleylpyruvate isomerase N-terminal domain-containing protein [Saccharopolyspora shandongensis]SDY36090.1 Mycothiol maleylpyruvate isomerase N-terminal domain-containing protein [Saccharopolyspora shandongensis]
MSAIREAYLQAAASAAAVLGDPAVAAAWDRPSALAEFSVRGLAGHLASQVLFVPRVLAAAEPEEEPVPLLGYYAKSEWIGADVNAEVNVRLREMGEGLATEGAAALVAEVDSVVRDLRSALPATPADRAVAFSRRVLRIDDFLITRMMEIAVHSDDLASSVGIATPELPPEVYDHVLALLSQLAVRRHGQTAVLRALSRAERAPATIAAI